MKEYTKYLLHHFHLWAKRSQLSFNYRPNYQIYISATCLIGQKFVKNIFVAIKYLHTILFHSLLQNGAVTYEVSKSLCNVPELKNNRLALHRTRENVNCVF